MEFGLEGGANFTDMSNVPGANTKPGFDLGFYFDFKLQNHLYLHTGVLGKSPMGAKGLPPYSIGDDNLDQAFAGGSVKRKLSYFHVPALLKYTIQEHYFVESGLQLGLLHKAIDEFVASAQDKNDLAYTRDIKDQYKWFDAGVTVGMGYRIVKGLGMSLGIRYYVGLMNVSKENTESVQHNNAFYLFATIPIGAGKAKAQSAEQSNE